jgi:hypothetical protein
MSLKKILMPWKLLPTPENPGAEMVLGCTPDGEQKQMSDDAAKFYERQRAAQIGEVALAKQNHVD